MNQLKKELTTRQIQAIQTQHKIYKVAVDMMQKKGFDNITVEDISREAGVSVGAFYHYFKSKNDILYEVFHRIDEYFEKEFHFENLSVPEQILLFFEYYAKYEEISGVDTARKLYSNMEHLFISSERYLPKLLNSIVKSGQEDGSIIDNIPSEEISEYLLVVARGVCYDWCLHNGSFDIEEMTIKYIKRLLPALLK